MFHIPAAGETNTREDTARLYSHGEVPSHHAAWAAKENAILVFGTLIVSTEC